jgi:lysophospholipase L1-like esterase
LIADLIRAQWASVVATPQAALKWTKAMFTKAKWHYGELSQLVIIGDSLSASDPSDTTKPSYGCSFATFLANQAHARLSTPQLASNSPRKSTRRRPISTAYNLAVGGSKVEHVLGDQSQIVWAEKLGPSTIIIWLGNNDVLTGLVEGDCSLVTSLTQFTTAYDEVVRRAAATGAKLVIGNIPDVTRLPFLIPATEIPALTRWSLAELERAFGITPADYTTRQSFDSLAKALSQHDADTLPRCVKLSASDVEKIRNDDGTYNDVIESRTWEYGAALVDIYSLSNNLFQDGFKIGRRLLTTSFLGGMFSTDGIHPSTTGHAIIANEFIRTINEHFGSCLPLINLHKTIVRDPLWSSRYTRIGLAIASTDDQVNSVSPLVEGEDYYREGAAIVFTAQYHLRRGYCCQTGCRHCPFKTSAA